MDEEPRREKQQLIVGGNVRRPIAQMLMEQTRREQMFKVTGTLSL